MSKRIIHFLSFVLLFACFCRTVAFAGSNAVTTYHIHNPDDWAKEAVCSLQYYGILPEDYIVSDSDWFSGEGYRRNILRDGVAFLLVNLYEFQAEAELLVPENSPFPMMPGFHNGSVKKAYGAGLMQGRSETDFGHGNITRQEFAVVLYRAAKVMDCFKGDTEAFFSNDSEAIADWALDAVSYVYNNGIMTVVTNDGFSPESYVTKEMAYACVHRFAVSHGIYEKLPATFISSIEFTPKQPIQGSVDHLLAAVSDKERIAIQKALELFPNAFELHADAGTNENGEDKKLTIHAQEGDFVLSITENGIYADIKFPYEAYDKYRDLVYAVIEISRYRDVYLDRYEAVREMAWDSDLREYSEYENFLNSDRVPHGISTRIAVEYDEPYSGIRISIQDDFRG